MRCSFEPDFLIDGKDTFKRRVGDLVTIKDCKHIGDCYAVVSSECRADSIKIISFDFKVKRICEKVVCGFGSFGTYHIDMSLKDRYRRVFVALRSILVYYDIADFVRDRVKIMGCCKFDQILSHAIRVA